MRRHYIWERINSHFSSQERYVITFSKKTLAQVFYLLLKLWGVPEKPIRTFLCVGAIVIYVMRRLVGHLLSWPWTNNINWKHNPFIYFSIIHKWWLWPTWHNFLFLNKSLLLKKFKLMSQVIYNHLNII